jgi:hypothetical protein
MNYSTQTVVAIISFAFGTVALQPAAADTDVRVAVAEKFDAHASSVPASQSLSDYAGRYESDGAAFIVDDDGTFLTLEVPETWGGATLRLRPHTAREFLADLSTRVTFQLGSDGRVSSLVFYAQGEGEAAVAAKVFPRGIVTIHDVQTPGVTGRAPGG